jgi:hypothetical protein
MLSCFPQLSGRLVSACRKRQSRSTARSGSFATGSSQQQVRPSPLCPDSDKISRRSEMTRWAISRRGSPASDRHGSRFWDQSVRRGRATTGSLSGTQTCPASETGLQDCRYTFPTKRREGQDVCVRAVALFHLKRPAAAELALDSGHRACRCGPATSRRTRPR